MPYLSCDHCGTILTGTMVNTPGPVVCPGCRMRLLARVFPAFFRAKATGAVAESVVSDEDATCFYHPRKKAVVPCAQCGRFLCALCDLEIDGRHLCPGCVSGSPARPNSGPWVQSRLRYDKLALAVAAWPLVPVLWAFTLLTAPIALFLALRHWKEPPDEPMPRGRWRVVTAALLAVGQIAVWAWIFFYRFVYLAVVITTP